MKFLTLLAVPLLLASCGTATLPTNTADSALTAQKVVQSEAQKVRAYGRSCAIGALVKLIEGGGNDYGFITPGATCTNSFLGVDALAAAPYIRTTAITASADRTAVNVTIRSKSRKVYVTTMDTDGNILFQTP